MVNAALGRFDCLVFDVIDQLGFFSARQAGVLPAEHEFCCGLDGDFVCLELFAAVLAQYASYGENRRCSAFGFICAGGVPYGYV